jgi:hypothetical protein
MLNRPRVLWSPASLAALAGLALVGCDVAAASRAKAPLPARLPTPSVAAAALPGATTAAPTTTAAPKPATAGLEIAIPAGSLRLGSPTGSALRNPAREADDLTLSLPAFSIDALPYPNDPALPPRASVARAEAERLCTEQGKRLCSELEWERACKGEENAAYPSPEFDAARCAGEPTACASSFGVFALGTLGREWTASDAGRADWDRLRSASVRGAPKAAEGPLHRCAARDAAAPESRSDSLLFRCCRGELPRATYPEQPEAKPFRPLALSPEALRAMLTQMPETRALAASFRLHRTSELLAALSVAGRTAESLSPWQSAGASFTWSPTRGEELVVLSGDSQSGATLVAYYPLPGTAPRFAGSYVTKDEHVPILLAYKDDTRDELLFSTCWGCGGEGGALRLDATSRLRFLPR